MDVVEAFQVLGSPAARERWPGAVSVVFQELSGMRHSFGELWEDQTAEFCTGLMVRGLPENARAQVTTASQGRGYLYKSVRRLCVGLLQQEQRRAELLRHAAPRPARAAVEIHEPTAMDTVRLLEDFRHRCLPTLAQMMRVDARARWMEDWERLEALIQGRATMEQLAQELLEGQGGETLQQARWSLQKRSSRFRTRALKNLRRARAQGHFSQEEAEAFAAFLETHCYLRRRPHTHRGPGPGETP